MLPRRVLNKNLSLAEVADADNKVGIPIIIGVNMQSSSYIEEQVQAGENMIRRTRSCEGGQDLARQRKTTASHSQTTKWALSKHAAAERAALAVPTRRFLERKKTKELFDVLSHGHLSNTQNFPSKIFGIVTRCPRQGISRTHGPK